MGMTYIMGRNKAIPNEWLEVSLNSSASMEIEGLLEYALLDKYEEIYNVITEEVIFITIDKLTKEQFNFFVYLINNIISNPNLPKKFNLSTELWNTYIQPLILQDERLISDITAN